MQILVIDDDPATVSLVSTILGGAGHAVVSASNGMEALEQLDGGEPDAIVLDLRMPLLDGRGFYRELRARHYTTPVLILSAEEAKQAQEELGAEGSMRKPFTAALLLTSIESITRRDEAS